MDALTSLLDGPRATRAFLLRTLVDAPWSLGIEDESPLTLVAMTAGSAVISYDGDEVHLPERGVALIKGPEPYVIGSSAHLPRQAIISPGQVCTAVNGEPLTDLTDLGVRTWGHSLNAATSMVTGSYHLAGDVSRALLRALPRVLVVDAGDSSALVALLDAELAVESPGQQAMLDRLLDLLLIATCRSWISRADAPGWLLAESDPIVGRAIGLMRRDLAQGWTVASLARATRTSRAAFAARFTEVAGVSPIAYLREARLAAATELLHERRTTVASIADSVGYQSAFALSAAFKKARGESPSQYRARTAGIT